VRLGSSGVRWEVQLQTRPWSSGCMVSRNVTEPLLRERISALAYSLNWSCSLLILLFGCRRYGAGLAPSGDGAVRRISCGQLPGHDGDGGPTVTPIPTKTISATT
jgi:hypothetical protein